MESTITVVVKVPGNLTLDQAGALQNDVRDTLVGLVDRTEEYEGVTVDAVYLSSRATT